ncbi:hypothetical protein HA402_001794 [Bradysia odoriphaga]|nr:hypothetical protein HA402_001794 [Bradysia odoriphaga]
MFGRSSITFNLIFLVISFHAVFAWLAPERCQQKSTFSSVPKSVLVDVGKNFARDAPTVGNISEIATNQKANLINKYKDWKFFGVPIRGEFFGCRECNYHKYAPSSCKFFTYEPNLLSSVYCQNDVACKLSRAVTTTSTYSAAEGYNWGVKASTKVTLIPSVFEIGGEASTGGTYSCTYTETRTTTDTVECSVSDGEGKTLQLHSVRSDMECQFSDVEMVPEERNGKKIAYAPSGYFTREETMETEAHPLIRSPNGMVLPDADRLSDTLLAKMWRIFPDYNPLTDMVALWPSPSNASVLYYKEGSIDPGPKRKIPFTNEAGDSVFQYACALT